MGMIWQARLVSESEVNSLRAEPDGVCDFVTSVEARKSQLGVDLGKEWHAVHYLLTDSPGPSNSPLNLIMSFGEPIGDDLGYGPASYVAPAFVAAFQHAITAISNTDLAARYDVDSMIRDDVYIADGLKADGPESLQFLIEHIDKLRVFAAIGAAKSLGTIWILT